MLMPSIALPTGPYDWHESIAPRAIYESRIEWLRAVMKERALTRTIVYGNVFDHAALGWFSHFTPKLGPALMLICADAAPQLLFSGGPGMRASAQRQTWVEDVAALRGMSNDFGAWLGEAVGARVGVVTGASMSFGDWIALEEGAGGRLLRMDDAIEAAWRAGGPEHADARACARILQAVADAFYQKVRPGAELRKACLDIERLAYRLGAQDVRLRVARKPWGLPTTLPDDRRAVEGPTPAMVAIRSVNRWTYGCFVAGEVNELALDARRRLQEEMQGKALVNRVSYPDPPKQDLGLITCAIENAGARWSGLCFARAQEREWLFLPPCG